MDGRISLYIAVHEDILIGADGVRFEIGTKLELQPGWIYRIDFCLISSLSWIVREKMLLNLLTLDIHGQGIAKGRDVRHSGIGTRTGEAFLVIT